MEFDGIELRELERIHEPYIPDGIKVLYINKGVGENIEATTTDYTIKGIRLLISSTHDDFERGEGIIITPKDKGYQLIGEIRHIVRVHNNITYLGIKFYTTKSLAVYAHLIETD